MPSDYSLCQSDYEQVDIIVSCVNLIYLYYLHLSLTQSSQIPTAILTIATGYNNADKSQLKAITFNITF